MGIPITINSGTNLQEPTSGGGINLYYDPEIAKKPLDRTTNIDPYDTINFTNIYTDDLSKYQKYNVPTTRYFNWDDQRAKNQGTGEKWLRGASKALVTTVGAVTENTLGVIAGLGEMAFGSGYYYDNFIGQSIDKANDWMREAMPNYRTQAEMDMTTGQKLGTANFWADTVLNGVGYSVGSIATMFLTGGTGLIMRTAGAIGKSQRAKNIYDVSKAITTGTKLADKTFKASRAQGLLNSANMLEMGLYMSLAEASVEAREAQKSAYDALIAKELEDRGLEREFELGDETIDDILNASYAAGNADFLAQLPVLAGTNLLMFGKQVAGFKTASKINKDVAFDNATKQVVNRIGERGFFRTGMSRLKPFAQGSLTEAFQEGWQFASKTGAINYHTDKYFNGGFSDMSESILQGLNETFGTQEGLESMLVGAIVGGGVSGVQSAIQKPYAQRQKNAKYLTDLLNGGFLRNASNKGMTSNMMTLALVQMEQARESGDIKAFKDAQNKLIMYNAFEALQNGGFDVFMEKLEDAASLEDSEFAKAFGYDTEQSIQKQTGKSKQQIIDNVKKKYQTFKETYDSINEAYPPADRKTGLPRMRMTEAERKAEEAVFQKREALRAQLILGMGTIKNRNSRLKSIHDNMQALLDSTVNLNNGSVLKDILALPQFGGENILEYNAAEEQENTRKRLNEVLQVLVQNNVDPVKITEFKNQAQDYLSLLAENQAAVEAHIKLSSDTFAQEQFEQERIKNEEAAKKKAKDSKDKKSVEEAKTSEDIKNNVKNAEGETKADAEQKFQDLKRQEQEAENEYLSRDKELPAKNRLRLLKAIDTSNLSDTERVGLVNAIEKLEKLEKQQAEKETPIQEDPDAQTIADILEQEETQEEEEVDAIQQEPEPAKREVVITDTSQLEIFDDVSVENDNNETPVLGLELAVDPTIWVSDKKVGVNENGVPDGSTGDTVNGKPIIISQEPLLGEVEGTEVEFVIIENDFFVENHKGKPTEIEQTPIYVKVGDTIVGKLQANKSDERKALVQKIRETEGQVEIERIQNEVLRAMTDMYNSETESKGSAFYGKEKVTYEEMQKLYDDVLARIRQRANANKILRSKGRKIITAEEVIDDIVQNYINNTPLQAMPVGNPGLFLLKEYIREQIDGTEVLRKKVTTKISKVVANNYNNAVLSEASNTSYFFNIKDVIGNGKTENVLLAFTAGTPGETDVVQWEVSPVSDEKNQSDLPKIQREAQREQAEGRIDQVAVVVRPENVPGGKARIYITSTANLSEDAQQKVIDLVLEKNYDAAKEIVAASQQRRGNDNPSFLEFNTFENGDKYVVYYSPKLRKLIRINETEMTKALSNPENKAFFDIVSIQDEMYTNKGKRNTTDLKFNLGEDFNLFLSNKKYHVDKQLANSTEEYFSPVDPQRRYDNYQEYLFSPAEVGDRVEGTGHYSILSIDAVKIGESLFNNPKVTFERGNVIGETKQEVVDKTDLTSMKKQVEVSAVDKAPKGFKDKFNKKNCK